MFLFKIILMNCFFVLWYKITSNFTPLQIFGRVKSIALNLQYVGN